MNVRSAVQDKANYADIVSWFEKMAQDQGSLNGEQLVLLVDTIGDMSEEIFEHYKALCNLLKGQLQRIRRICREEGYAEAFPEETMRSQMAYVIEKACRERMVLAEKYEDLANEFHK